VPRILQAAVPKVVFQSLVAGVTRMTARHLAEATASRRLSLLVVVTVAPGSRDVQARLAVPLCGGRSRSRDGARRRCRLRRRPGLGATLTPRPPFSATRQRPA
jgi:hypothetical protein